MPDISIRRVTRECCIPCAGSFNASAVKDKYPGASYADLWTLAGVVAIKYMDGPSVKWSPGRTDATAPTTVPDGESDP